MPYRLRLLPYAPLLLLRTLSRAAPTIDADVARWVEHYGITGLSGAAAFLDVARRWREFRSVLYARLRDDGRVVRALARLLRAVYRPMPLVFIYTKRIGPGLFLEHGFSTVIDAEEIGEGCQINHGVTVGWTGRGRPSIGSRVEIGTGAKVLGPVTVGDHAWVGAGAVVVDDVPAGMTAVGVPARMRPKGRNPLT